MRFERKERHAVRGSNMNGNNIPKSVIARLPTYLHYLKGVAKNKPTVSSAWLAGALGLGEVQVRKDLAMVSGAGKPKIGYVTTELIGHIEDVLGSNEKHYAVIVGAGKLGLALLLYEGFSEYGTEILAAFDKDDRKCGLAHFGKPIYAVDGLKAFCESNSIDIGIITVPEAHAQSVCDVLTDSGVKAILNFSPTVLSVPQGVKVNNVNVAASLAMLLAK